MKATVFRLPCPACGELFSLAGRDIRRNSNLVLTCERCGQKHLALNDMQMAVYRKMKELGYEVGDPPTPEPLEPIRTFPTNDGRELVLRRNKTTGSRIYYRRIKRPKPAGK